MNFYDVISNRRSVRSYKSDSISDDILNRIAEAVNCAPSACNLQPWRFEIILNTELRTKITECCACFGNEWMQYDAAPAIVVVIGDKEKCWKRPDEKTPIVEVDAAIAMDHFVLAAAAEELGTCWICAYQMDWLNHILGIEENEYAVALSTLGYPVEHPKKSMRKPLDDVFKIIR
ncbi:MAG: nitroreductase [Lentisphaerae bacterium]|nr:nitroreductase [Lentisphaerota bacterium]MCP4101530.1 nitroreductase [Lentisphaerota bacterium]